MFQSVVVGVSVLQMAASRGTSALPPAAARPTPATLTSSPDPQVTSRGTPGAEPDRRTRWTSTSAAWPSHRKKNQSHRNLCVFVFFWYISPTVELHRTDLQYYMSNCVFQIFSLLLRSNQKSTQRYMLCSVPSCQAPNPVVSVNYQENASFI